MGLGDLGHFVLAGLIGSRHGAIGCQQDPQRPCHRFPATGEDRAHPGAETEHGGIHSGSRLRKLPSLALQLVKQIDALRTRLDSLDIDALSPREALDLLYELKREAGKLP